MKYAEAREKIKTGDMLLWRDHKGGSPRSRAERWLVRRVTGSPYTHVGVALVDHGRVCVMDLTTKGCAPRPLSLDLPFDWAPAPRELSVEAINYAWGCFGLWTYSRWQAVLGFLQRLTIGRDTDGQCAEYALSIWMQDMMLPTHIATPGACADGAVTKWESSIERVTQ